MEVHELLTEHGDISDYPPEQRILIAAIECIRDSGLEGATVRAIASRAGVNPAAVNYYYRSKDRVIEEALRAAWAHVAEDIDAIMKETPDPQAASRLAVRYLLEGSFGSPRVIRAVVVEHPALHSEVARFFRTLFGRFPKSGRGRDSNLTWLLLFAMSVFISVAPNVAAVLAGVRFSDRASRERFWDELAEALLGPAGGRARRAGADRTRRHQKASPRLK